MFVFADFRINCNGRFGASWAARFPQLHRYEGNLQLGTFQTAKQVQHSRKHLLCTVQLVMLLSCRTDYSPPRLEEDSPSIMGEISNSFSSHMFRNSHRSRNYSSPRRRNPLEDLEENIVPGAESRSINSQSLMDSSRASSKKTRLYRSELLKSKHSTGAIYPESPESRSPLAAQAAQDFSLIPSIEERETSHQAVVDLSLPRFSTSNRPTNHHFLS